MKNRSSFALRAFFCMVVALASFPALAAASGNYDGPKWDVLDTKKVLADAAQITPDKYPDCDDATVEKKMVRIYRADGTGECQDETFTKVLTEKGKRGNRSLSLYYMLPYSTAEAVKLETIKPNGDVVPVDIPANSKEMIDDSQMSMNIYDPNSKILRVNIPKVDIGDVVHSITRTTIQRSVIPGEFSDDNVFEGSGYIHHLTYEVYEPGDKPLKRIILRDEVKGTIKHTTETVSKALKLHRWEVTEVPRMFDEPGMPSYEVVLQRLMVSTTPDWQSVSKWYWNVCKPHLDATTPDMQKTVEDLTAGPKTDMDRIKAIFYHVAQKIRYMGLTPEKDRPGFEPHDVKLTFCNKYGVCRDKAALLVSLLRGAGFNAYPVLVNVGTKRDQDVPEPAFNHAIVGVELKKGQHILMDPTAENTKDLLPSYECDQSYLLCRPEGDTLRTSPIHPPEENMMRIKTTASLTPAGTLEAHSELWFDGINDTEYREAFSHMKPDDKLRFFERNLKRTMPGARVKSLKLMPEEIQDVSVGLHAELDFTADGMTASGNGKSVVNLPWIGKGVGIANFILGGTGLEKRKYPLRTEIACGLTEEVTVKLDDGFTGSVSMPAYPPVDDKTMSYHRKVELKNQSLACSRELKLKTVEFSPDQYLKLKQILKGMDYDERKAPVLAISSAVLAKAETKNDSSADPAVESNARILESHKDFEIKDAHTEILKGRFVKQVLTYSGKKNEAEFKLGYNPACEEVKLVRAIVTSKTGQKQEIATNEVNVMDAGWNASAKRYTGGKILVANLPAVDIGSTIEVEYEVITKNKPFLAGFETFQTFDDVEKKEVRVIAPAGVDVQSLVTGDKGIVSAQTNTANGSQVFDWQAEHVKALPAESQLPPEWVYMAGVEFFAGDVKAYWKELNETLTDRSGKNAKATELAKQLTNGKSKQEAVKAIRDYVAKFIRVAGPSFTELPLSELSSADITLADGYGHAADHAILLHAMLSAAGFQPQFVLASGLPPISGITNVATTFPLPQNFQTPLVRVSADKETYYLNDTDQYAELGTTPNDGRLAVVLSSQNFDVVHAAHDCRDKTETVYSLSLGNDGKTRVGITRQYYGGGYNSKHRYFSELPPEERRRYFQELVSGVAQGARAIGDLTTRFDNYPGTEQYTVEVDNFSVVDGKYSYFDLPFTPSLFPMGADHRTLPLYIGHHGEHRIRTEIDLPSRFRQIAIAPMSETFEAPDGSGSAKITSTESGGKRIITHEFETSPAIVSAKDYPEMLKVESALGKKSSKTFLLEASPITAE
jgi:transglutaminase-like putative cysteine protease